MKRCHCAVLSLLAVSGCLLPVTNQDTDSSSTSSTSGGDTSTTTTTGDTSDTSDTTAAPTSSGPGPTCGDGLQDPGEACDDGERNSNTAACTLACARNICGDGLILAGEEDCDAGPGNADDAACTSTCTAARCGDGLLLAGKEQCDDTVNDGSYNSCTPDCSARASHCGDNILDTQEACDIDDPSCIGCTVATSCLKIHEADPALPSGPHMIFPIGPDNPLAVYCDMESDGGGYTFLKVDIDSELNDLPYPANKAEQTCAMFGMHLLVPHSPAHLAVAHSVAVGADILPVGGGSKQSGADYLQILGIYPKQSSKSCLGKALGTVSCPQWGPADGGEWFISDTVKNISEPDPDGACLGCSMLFTWNPDGSVKNYKTLPNPGGSSLRFMCEVGDKLP